MSENLENAVLQLHGDGDPVDQDSPLTCGTVTGSWHFYGPGLNGWPVRVLGIVDVYNKPAGNGQFAPFLHQLIAHCTEQQLDLAGMDVNNRDLAAHLIKEWGFQPLPNSSHLVRSCCSASADGGASQAPYQ